MEKDMVRLQSTATFAFGIIIWGVLCFSSCFALSLSLFTVHTYTNCVIHCNDKASTECLAFILVLGC